MLTGDIFTGDTFHEEYYKNIIYLKDTINNSTSIFSKKIIENINTTLNNYQYSTIYVQDNYDIITICYCILILIQLNHSIQHAKFFRFITDIIVLQDEDNKEDNFYLSNLLYLTLNQINTSIIQHKKFIYTLKRGETFDTISTDQHGIDGYFRDHLIMLNNQAWENNKENWRKNMFGKIYLPILGEKYRHPVLKSTSPSSPPASSANKPSPTRNDTEAFKERYRAWNKKTSDLFEKRKRLLHLEVQLEPIKKSCNDSNPMIDTNTCITKFERVLKQLDNFKDYKKFFNESIIDILEKLKSKPVDQGEYITLINSFINNIKVENEKTRVSIEEIDQSKPSITGGTNPEPQYIEVDADDFKKYKTEDSREIVLEKIKSYKNTNEEKIQNKLKEINEKRKKLNAVNFNLDISITRHLYSLLNYGLNLFQNKIYMWDIYQSDIFNAELNIKTINVDDIRRNLREYKRIFGKSLKIPDQITHPNEEKQRLLKLISAIYYQQYIKFGYKNKKIVVEVNKNQQVPDEIMP